MVVVRDVSERQAREAQLREDALHDPLTELPNRTLFADRLALALRRRRRSHASVAVLFVDIDDFKSVNDQLGHRAGDELMIAIAGRLRRGLRGSDTAARLGGDEFAILLEPADETDATHVADRILAAFDEPFMVEGESREIGASIGIATSFDPSDTGSELLAPRRSRDVRRQDAGQEGRLRGVPAADRGSPARGAVRARGTGVGPGQRRASPPCSA